MDIIVSEVAMHASRISRTKLAHMQAKINGDEDTAKRTSDQLEKLEAVSRDIIMWGLFMEALNGSLMAYISRLSILVRLEKTRV